MFTLGVGIVFAVLCVFQGRVELSQRRYIRAWFFQILGYSGIVAGLLAIGALVASASSFSLNVCQIDTGNDSWRTYVFGYSYQGDAAGALVEDFGGEDTFASTGIGNVTYVFPGDNVLFDVQLDRKATLEIWMQVDGQMRSVRAWPGAPKCGEIVEYTTPLNSITIANPPCRRCDFYIIDDYGHSSFVATVDGQYEGDEYFVRLTLGRDNPVVDPSRYFVLDNQSNIE